MENCEKLKMLNHAGIYVFLILLIFTHTASAAYMREVRTNPESIDPQSEFSVIVELGGTTCGTQMEFYIDDMLFESKNIGCYTDDVESDDWDLEKNPIECGIHTLKVNLLDSGEIIQTEIKELKIGNVPSIVINPEEPSPNRDATFTFKNNETGKIIVDLDVGIYNMKKGPSSSEEYTTNNNGEIKFISDVTGEFKLEIDDSDYCGTLNFWVKKPMPFAGPNPPDPVVGERIGVAVPAGVGVKYIDSEGNIYPLRNFGGGVNFTINTAGDYTLIAGDLSTIYWSITKEFTVSDKAKVDITITPEKAVVNKVLLLTVRSRGAPLEGAEVEITKPIGGSEKLETNSAGEVRFTPESAGRYHYKIEKARYETLEDDFEAYNSLEIKKSPEEPISDQDIGLNVTNQMGDRVDNAVISIEDENGVLVTGGTGIDGSFKFRVQEPKEYTLKILKDGYWSLEEKLRVYGIISLKLCPEKIEIGEGISISVTDKQGDETSAGIIATKPDGRTEEVDGKTYSPDWVGDYEITAVKEGYKSVTQALKVNPHPLELDRRVEGDKLIIEVTSHNEPVPGITFEVKTPTEEKTVVTDNLGIVTAAIDREGDIVINANTIDINVNYDSIEITEKIAKQYNYLLLVIPLFIILVIAFAMLLTIDHLHKGKVKIRRVDFTKKGRESKGLIEKSKQSTLSKL